MKLRFAAGTAGPLHVVQARIALLNWLHARRHGARFILRHDDADAPGAAEAAEADLAWLGLDWDETVRQSGRLPLYEAAAGRLKASGRLYPCFESEEELNAKRDQRQRRGDPAIYDRAMLKLTPEQRSRAEAGGKRPYWRFLLSAAPAQWSDLLRGRREVKLSAMSDPVAIRADGTVLPVLCSAVDDIECGVTHVLRSEDHAAGTGIQIDVTAALGATPPRFAHLPPLATGAKGVQRPAAMTLRHLRADGMEPSALVGTLARLGTPDDHGPAMPADLAPGFDLKRIGPNPPRLDPYRLLATNRRALQSLPFEHVQDRLPPGATPAFWNAVRGSLDLLREARGWWEVVTGTIVPPLVEGEAELMGDAAATLPPEPWDGGTWSRWLHALSARTGRDGPSLHAPLHLALTGEDQGPDLAALLPLMGHVRVAERLRLAAA